MTASGEWLSTLTTPIFAKPNLCDTDTVVKYISRYLGRPVIATSRIDSYDGENVTFHYNKHEDNSYVKKSVSVMDFISLLIQHIPEKYFKMTRYYGLYARHRKSDETLRKVVPKSKHRLLLDFISCLLHTENINRQEAYNGSKVYRGTQAKIYQKSSSSNSIRLICVPSLCGLFYSRFLRQEKFPIKQKKRCQNTSSITLFHCPAYFFMVLPYALLYFP